MKRVLIPVDGSDRSLRAIDYVIAQRAARAVDDIEIHLVNVQAPVSGDIAQFVGHDQLASFHRDESAKALRPAEARLDAAHAHCASHAQLGHAAEAIIELADRLQCDHIVMATHGRGALADLLLGSTTVRVVHLAHMPVVLVK